MASLMRTIVIATFAALVGAAASQPSDAATRSVAHRGASAFDGSWSVVMQTTRGNCPAAVRAGVRILGGRLSADDPSYVLDGRVAPGGAVRVTVSAAGQTGGAIGFLSHAVGRGRWRTQSGDCAGEWTAARRDYGEPQ
jgi:hypothetical protein